MKVQKDAVWTFSQLLLLLFVPLCFFDHFRQVTRYGPSAKSDPPLVSVDKVLLEKMYSPLFTNCLWLLLQ